jgi:hypothetical protein
MGNISFYVVLIRVICGQKAKWFSADFRGSRRYFVTSCLSALVGADLREKRRWSVPLILFPKGKNFSPDLRRSRDTQMIADSYICYRHIYLRNLRYLRAKKRQAV